ncbi:MAG: hypothetical protein ACI9J3_003845, partial [Parvicellaceae bacterium]
PLDFDKSSGAETLRRFREFDSLAEKVSFANSIATSNCLLSNNGNGFSGFSFCMIILIELPNQLEIKKPSQLNGKAFLLFVKFLATTAFPFPICIEIKMGRYVVV